MSIFIIKDINYKLIDFLTIKDIFNISHVNKFYFYFLNIKLWKIIFYKKINSYTTLKEKYINYYDENWKKYCITLHNFLNNNNTVLSIYKTIKNDYLDIFLFILNFNNLNIYNFFNSGKYEDPESYNIKSDKILRFNCIELSIEKNSLNCFKYLYKRNQIDKNLITFYFERAILKKSDNILKYLLKKNPSIVNINLIKTSLVNKYKIPGLYEKF
jgi:hypothetical protein